MPVVGEIVETRRIQAEELFVEWQIEDFLLLRRKRSALYDSPLFTFCKEAWCLQMWLIESRYITLRLTRIDGCPSETFAVAIKTRVNGVERELQVEMKFSGYGCSWLEDFCPRTDLINWMSTLMQDNVLTITCVIKKLNAARVVEEWQESLGRLLANGEDSDCLIKVQDIEFPVHRAILGARSPVFHDMFRKQSGIVTNDCNLETFPTFLQHVYTGSVEMITERNIFSLYMISKKYCVKVLKKACEEFVEKNLTIAFFFDAIALALKCEDKELIEIVTDYFCRNWCNIMDTREWLIFFLEHPNTVIELNIKAASKKLY